MNVIENAMTTMTSLHAAFGRLDFSLDELEGEKDTYRITTYGDFMSFIDALLMPPNFRVKFSTPDTRWLPTPSPVALRMRRQNPSQDRYC